METSSSTTATQMPERLSMSRETKVRLQSALIHIAIGCAIAVSIVVLLRIILGGPVNLILCFFIGFGASLLVRMTIMDRVDFILYTKNHLLLPSRAQKKFGHLQEATK